MSYLKIANKSMSEEIRDVQSQETFMDLNRSTVIVFIFVLNFSASPFMR